MSSKTKRRLLQFLGFLIGLLFGWFRPEQMQTMLPPLGIGVGVAYFILSQGFADEDTKLSDIVWFIPVQMVMYFIIGGAITSSIHLAMQFL